MKEDTYRVLDTLGRSLGRPLAISELTDRARAFHDRAHYKNIHQAVEELEDEGVVRVERRGGAALVELDLSRGRTIDRMATAALKGKRQTQLASERLDTLATRLGSQLAASQDVRTAMLIDPLPNATLNRAVALVITPSGLGEDRIQLIYEAVAEQASHGNTRVDPLVLTEAELIEALGASVLTAPQVLVTYRETLLHAEAFGWLLHRAHGLGQRIACHDRLDGSDPNHGLIRGLDEADIAASLDRLGYEEMGAQGSGGRRLSMELAVTAALARGDARRRYGAAVVLAKNQAERWNPRTLAFLATQHDVGTELAALTRALLDLIEELAIDPAHRSSQRARLGTLEARLAPGRADAGEIQAVDERRLREVLEVYDALG